MQVVLGGEVWAGIEPFVLHTQHHGDVHVLDDLIEGGDLPQPSHLVIHPLTWPGEDDASTQSVEDLGVGAGNPGMGDVSTDRDGEVVEMAELLGNRHEVQHALAGMLA